MVLKLEAIRYTTREGDHPDDELYLEQVKLTLIERLQEMQFIRPDIKLEWAP